MQLFNSWALNIIVTALIASGVIASASTLSVCAFRVRGRQLMLFFVSVFAFSLLGFVTGETMADSRQSAVGTVIPAALTLLGGIAAFVVGSKGARAQVTVSMMVLCFAFALLVGSIFGTRLRIEFDSSADDPMRLRLRDLALEQNALAVEVQRLEDYIEVLKLRRDFSEQEKLDLSRFESTYEASKASTPPQIPTK
jgi:hypothetical protein